ncbi:WD40/YVTN/BNR-like repeat-containing protein [Fodinicola acaciae]|uniref:WD40/YVTN/BNR-like repeat-containing protein n=1 Tax=Fodinicola acaciae TaxID=2681555 RepID=UPI0013D4D7A3|nr:hypothetical protein [Fodinicola acaciae]
MRRLDLEDGFAGVRAGVVERGALPELPAVRALGRRRRRHRHYAMSTLFVAVLAVVGLAGWSVPQVRHSLAAGQPRDVAAAVTLDRTVQLEQVVPVDRQITYALGRSNAERSWVLAVTSSGGVEWTGYQVPIVAFSAVTRMTVLTATTVRVSQLNKDTDVVTKDMGRSWQKVDYSLADPVPTQPPAWVVGPGVQTKGLTATDPATGVEHEFGGQHLSVQNGGYDAVSATDGSLWGFGPYGGKASGNPATVWVSRDRGRTWRDFTPRPDTPMRTGAVATYDGSVGYVAVDASDDLADGSKLYTTHDYGQHWTYVASTAQALTALELLADNRTLIGLLGDRQLSAGGKQVMAGTLVRSEDGGRTFRPVGQAALVPAALSGLTTTVGGGYAVILSGADPSSPERPAATVDRLNPQALFSPDGRSWTAAPVPPVAL